MPTQSKTDQHGANIFFVRFVFVLCFGVAQGLFFAVLSGDDNIGAGMLLFFGALSGWFIGSILVSLAPLRKLSAGGLLTASVIMIVGANTIPVKLEELEMARQRMPEPVLEILRQHNEIPKAESRELSAYFYAQGLDHPVKILERLSEDLRKNGWSVTYSSGLPEGKSYYSAYGYQSWSREYQKHPLGSGKKQGELRVRIDLYSDGRTRFFIRQPVHSLVVPYQLLAGYLFVIAVALVFGLIVRVK